MACNKTKHNYFSINTYIVLS